MSVSIEANQMVVESVKAKVFRMTCPNIRMLTSAATCCKKRWYFLQYCSTTPR